MDVIPLTDGYESESIERSFQADGIVGNEVEGEPGQVLRVRVTPDGPVVILISVPAGEAYSGAALTDTLNGASEEGVPDARQSRLDSIDHARGRSESHCTYLLRRGIEGNSRARSSTSSRIPEKRSD